MEFAEALLDDLPYDGMLLAVAAYAIAINLAGFLAFAWDKRCARKGTWRVPEKTLLTLAAIGGSIGAIAGQRVLRHKTFKEPFRTNLLMIVVIQVVVAVIFYFPQIRSTLEEFW